MPEQPTSSTATLPNSNTIRPRYRIRLKVGFHTDNDPDGKSTLYRQGDVFLCRKPLYRKWPEKFERVEDYVPLQGGDMKIATEGEQTDPDDEYDPISDSSPTNQPVESQGGASPTLPQKTAATKEKPLIESDEVLNSMTVMELKSYAEDEEIDLRGASRKEDILKILRQHR